MTLLSLIELWIGRIGGAGILLCLAIIFFGIFKGIRRFDSTPQQKYIWLLRSPLFYLVASAAFFWFCWQIWRPLPFSPSLPVRVVSLIIGTPLLFTGIGLILWGRFSLGSEYFVSTGRQAALFSDHRLITSGAYALVRHPMYLGILLVGLGGLLLYRTWTMVFISLMYFGLRVRARREEEALEPAFGIQYHTYQDSVPPWFPKIRLSEAKTTKSKNN